GAWWYIGEFPEYSYELISCKSLLLFRPQSMDDESRISDAGSTDNSLDTQTGDTKKRKEMQSRSGVWAHFDK
ncbi:hypothetical protein HAX54_029487, partial [Datura stramonium]|nr:hypothetical protein [Datura stramonium]